MVVKFLPREQQSPPTLSHLTTSDVSVGVTVCHLTPSNLGLTDEEWEEFSDPTCEEWDLDDSADGGEEALSLPEP